MIMCIFLFIFNEWLMESLCRLSGKTNSDVWRLLVMKKMWYCEGYRFKMCVTCLDRIKSLLFKRFSRKGSSPGCIFRIFFQPLSAWGKSTKVTGSHGLCTVELNLLNFTKRNGHASLLLAL